MNSIEILEVIACDNDEFKYRVLLNHYGSKKSIYFGDIDESFFTETGDEIYKQKWINLALNKSNNKDILTDLRVCAFLFEYHILFGESDNIIDNIISLNKKLLNKYQSVPVWLYFD